MGKIKEILTNKWGWAFAVMSIVAITFVPFGVTALGQNTFGKIWPSIFWNSVWTARAGYLIVAALGFILGIIAQKLWRKFR